MCFLIFSAPKTSVDLRSCSSSSFSHTRSWVTLCLALRCATSAPSRTPCKSDLDVKSMWRVFTKIHSNTSVAVHANASTTRARTGVIKSEHEKLCRMSCLWEALKRIAHKALDMSVIPRVYLLISRVETTRVCYLNHAKALHNASIGALNSTLIFLFWLFGFSLMWSWNWCVLFYFLA